MNRKFRRMLEKQGRADTIRVSPARLEEIKEKISGDSVRFAFEDIVPLFVMYLVEHFHCKSDGVFKFMNWFDSQMKLINDDHTELENFKKRLKDEAGVEIKYMPD